MTKTKYNRQTPHSRLWNVRLTPEIMDYLAIPTKFGASRLSAYLYLLHNVAETKTPYKPAYGQTFNLETGQLVISITDLADRWNWARGQCASSSTNLRFSGFCQRHLLTAVLSLP